MNWPTINTEFLWQVYQVTVASAYDYYKGLTTVILIKIKSNWQCFVCIPTLSGSTQRNSKIFTDLEANELRINFQINVNFSNGNPYRSVPVPLYIVVVMHMQNKSDFLVCSDWELYLDHVQWCSFILSTFRLIYIKMNQIWYCCVMLKLIFDYHFSATSNLLFSCYDQYFLLFFVYPAVCENLEQGLSSQISSSAR